ncbi:MAG: AarF/ABC1/UbiB kinase family protein, partial [Pseudomonadota bacterium]
VFMDRAAIGLGAAYLRLGAELNFHRLFEESLEGFTEEAVHARQSDGLIKAGLV